MRGKEAIKRLKLALRIDPAEDIRDDAWAELSGESHRACIILGTTLIEDKLEAALRARMSHLSSEHLKDLFDINRPLGTFSAKIDIAHGFGIVRRRERDSCHIMRELRNLAAHARRPFSFAMPELMAVMGTLFERPVEQNYTGEQMRMAFVGACGTLALSIEHGHEAAMAMVDEMANEVRDELRASPEAPPI